MQWQRPLLGSDAHIKRLCFSYSRSTVAGGPPELLDLKSARVRSLRHEGSRGLFAEELWPSAVGYAPEGLVREELACVLSKMLYGGGTMRQVERMCRRQWAQRLGITTELKCTALVSTTSLLFMTEHLEPASLISGRKGASLIMG